MNMVDEKFEIRKAEKEDLLEIYSLMKELAEFQNLKDKFIGSINDLEKFTFGENKIAYLYCGWLKINKEYKLIGYTLHYLNYSSFYLKPGIYLEDIYVKKEYRGLGFGKKLILFLCNLANENQYKFVEFQVLNTNKSSIKFYESLNSKIINDWLQYRISDENLLKLSKDFKLILN